MTDRELLELAAKAAGIDGAWFEGYLPTHPGHFGVNIRPDGHSFWSPLTDDGDALRLALKITRDFEPYRSQGFGWIIGKTNEEVRRAIVRAAAELGKETK